MQDQRLDNRPEVILAQCAAALFTDVSGPTAMSAVSLLSVAIAARGGIIETQPAQEVFIATFERCLRLALDAYNQTGCMAWEVDEARQ